MRHPWWCLLLSACTLTRHWDDLGPKSTDAGEPVPESFGGAVRFSSACAGASDALSNVLEFGAGQSFTIELWYQADRFDQFNLPVHDGGSSLNYAGWDIEIDSTGGLGFYASDGAMIQSVAAVPQIIVLNHAYHMVATRDGARAELWLLDATNGEKLHRSMSIVDNFPTSWDNSLPFTVGGSATAVGNCVDYTNADGIIDEVRVWNTVRSGIELDRDYDQPIACDTPGLVAYSRLDEGNGAVLGDCSASQIHLDIVGGSAPTEYEWVTSPFDL